MGYPKEQCLNQFKVLRTDDIVEHQDIPFNFNRFVYAIRDWFNSATSFTKLRGILSRSMENNIEFNRYCVPINNGNLHWVLLDCILPNDDYHNGLVTTFDHLYGTASKSQMWWAKLLGMYHQQLQHKKGIGSGNIYCGFDDMKEKSYEMKEGAEIEEHSSLNHSVADHSNLCVQGDQMNCGVWVIIEMLKRIKWQPI